MNKEEKISKCTAFFEELALKLAGSYEVVGSCNNDISSYLIPEGTISDLSYYGKPAASFRFSDHWNWFSSIRKCSDPTYVQCRSVDMPWCRKREEEGKPTKPIYGIQVAFYGSDGLYHHVFGEKFDRKTKTWDWVEQSVDDVMAQCL